MNVNKTSMKALVVLVLAVAGSACTLQLSQKEVLTPNQNNSGVTGGDAGTADAGCTPGDVNDWPVKVLFLVDNRGSMCVVDPPGTQENAAGGFCEQYSTVPPGVTMPARARALMQFWSRHQNETNVWGSFTWWAPGARGFSFQPVSTGFPAESVSELTSHLGTAGDLEGALLLVKQRLEADMQASTVAQRARTKYVVVVVHSGVPYPMCNANDAASSYATPANPDGRWADSRGATDFCNQAQPGTCDPLTGKDTFGQVCLPGFVPGTDRNQPAALRQIAADIASLRTTYGVGALSVHTRLLFDRTGIDACGPICTDLLGMPPDDAHTVGSFMLSAIATAAGGDFADPGKPDQLDLTTIDATSLAPTCTP